MIPKSIVLTSDRTSAKVFWMFTFALLTAVGAQVEIPHVPVPFTAQTLFVLLAGGLLGSRSGFGSMLAYLIIGTIGLPVFAGLSSGVGKLFGPTGGYLLAFPVAAFVAGWITDRNASLLGITLAMVSALVLLFAAGVAYLNTFYVHDWLRALQSGAMIFSWWDVAKLAAAVSITHQYRRRLAARD